MAKGGPWPLTETNQISDPRESYQLPGGLIGPMQRVKEQRTTDMQIISPSPDVGTLPASSA